jgi:hypothetical protein
MKKHHVVFNLATGAMTSEPMPDGVTLEQLMDDCPECQAARARGEMPMIGTGEELKALIARKHPAFRKPRWRNIKRRR